MDDKIKTVTFGVIAYNEQRYLPDLLADLLEQTYPKNNTEVIFVDGISEDKTLSIMNAFKQQYSALYKNIKVLSNEKRNQPSGWNVVIKNFESDLLLRIDAHAKLPKDFIEKNVECINNGEFVCGGPRINIIDENTAWKRMLLMAEQSMFGAGIATYRQETNEKKYVNSVFHGAYRREVFEKVGLFNENLVRTEDNEFHYRIREAGYQICYDPQIYSYYQTRNTLIKMLTQKFLNGFWIGRTLFICPKCISLFHLVPFFFVLSIIITTIAGFNGLVWMPIVLWTAYGLANIGMTINAVFTTEKKSLYLLLLPVVFFLLHTSYGVGTLFGVVDRR